MPKSIHFLIFGFGLIICILSLTAIIINAEYYHYPGNNYFPPDTLTVALTLPLLYWGIKLQFGHQCPPTLMVKEAIYFFLIMSVIALATNAAQYTPFPPIDIQLLKIDHWLHINMKEILLYTHHHPSFENLLRFAYNALPIEMCYLPLLAIILQRFTYCREYYFLMLFCTLIGFSIYYFFPTKAPASLIESIYFTEEQRATGFKFMQIHQHIQPSTLAGGMIALPSFHVIWAWLCLYLVRFLPIVFIILLPLNLLIIISCVLLGWHYLIDVIFAVIVLSMAHGAYFIALKKSSASKHLSL